MLIHTAIEQKLLDAFNPIHLDVVNESANHNVPPGSESHFKVVIVTPQFEGMRLLQRHRAVNAIVAEELAETREKLDSLIILMDPIWRAHKRELEGVR